MKVIGPVVAVESIVVSFNTKASSADAPCDAADDGAKIRMPGRIGLKVVKPEDHIRKSAGTVRHLERSHNPSIGQHLQAGTGGIGQGVGLDRFAGRK